MRGKLDEVFGEMKWLAEVEQFASAWNILNHGSWEGSYSLPEVLMGTFVRGRKERLHARKQTMEPENDGSKKEPPLPDLHFQVPC